MAKKKNLFSKDPNEKFNEKFYEKVVKDMKDDEQFRRFKRYSEKFHGDEVNRALYKLAETFGNIMLEVVEDDKLSNELKHLLNTINVHSLLKYYLKSLVRDNKDRQHILENLLGLVKVEESGANMLRDEVILLKRSTKKRLDNLFEKKGEYYDDLVCRILDTVEELKE